MMMTQFTKFPNSSRTSDPDTQGRTQGQSEKQTGLTNTIVFVVL